MAERDRLDWIFDSEADELVSRYDRWAATYDDDNDEWGWRGPELVAEAALRLGRLDPHQSIYDAGCGTGRVGMALRRAGWRGSVVGLDMSVGMLEVAARSGAYDQLIRCSLFAVPLTDDVAGAIVSSGVFTHGHVGGAALGELARITMPGGVVSLTLRVDIEADIRRHADALADTGSWQLVERTAPQPMHPGRDETLQTITTWMVR